MPALNDTPGRAHNACARRHAAALPPSLQEICCVPRRVAVAALFHFSVEDHLDLVLPLEVVEDLSLIHI